MPGGTVGPPSPFAATVVSEIRAEMGRIGVNQSEIAQRTGLKKSHLSTRLRGTLPLNLNELEEIANALNISASLLLRRAEERLNKGR
jgi:transcriptional regulator with XRE-family HTH domain